MPSKSNQPHISFSGAMSDSQTEGRGLEFSFCVCVRCVSCRAHVCAHARECVCFRVLASVRAQIAYLIYTTI